MSRRVVPAWRPALASLGLVMLLGIGVRQWVVRKPSERRFTRQEVARAEEQVQWVLGHLGRISARTTTVIESDVLQQQVAEPAARAIGRALETSGTGLGTGPKVEAR
jgi:hypothetical protein